MIDPALFDNLRIEIEKQYGPLNDDQNPSEEWYQAQNQLNPEGEKIMRRKLFELVRDIPHFRDLIQISQKVGKFEQLCKKMSFKKYSKGDILFKQYSSAHELILVVEGQISMWQLKSDPDINVEQKLIQTIEKSMKAYRREEAKVELEKIRNLEEDSVFHIVAERNVKRLQMQKTRRRLNNLQTVNFDLSHTNTFCFEKNDNITTQTACNTEQQLKTIPSLSGISEGHTRNNSGQISNVLVDLNNDIPAKSEQVLAQENRYFKTDNICKYKRIYYHQPGDFIGEKEALSNDSMDFLGIAQSDRVLAFTIPTDTYLSMFDLESAKTEFIVKCLQKQFPTARYESLLRIAYDFKSQSYDYNQPIFHLRDKADRIFIVKSGLVEVGQENLIKLALLGEGQLLGFEDCISEEKYRNFWATSKSGETLLFYIDSSLFQEIVDKTYDGKLKRALIENTSKKLNYYQESTSKIQDIFTKAAPKKKHANVDSPILSYMVSNSKSRARSQNNGYLDNAYKSFIASKTDSSGKRKETNSSNDEIPHTNHTPQIMTQKFKSMNHIKSEASLDESTSKPYFPSNRKTSDQEQFQPSPQLRYLTEAKEMYSPQKEQHSPLMLPNIHLNASPNPHKRVQITLDCFDPSKQKNTLNVDRMSERKVKSLANIPDDFELLTERDRQLQNIEKNSNKNILKTIDRAIEYKQQILQRKPKPLPTEKEDAFMTAFKYQKARYHSVFTQKKPGLPFKNRQFEHLQSNLKKLANDNLICRKSEQNLQVEDDEEPFKYPKSAIYFNDLDETSQCPYSMPVTNRKQNDRPSSLQHIDMDFDSQNNSINNIHIQSLNKLSPLKTHVKQNKNNIGIYHLNKNTSKQNNTNSHAHTRSTPFIKNIFLNDVTKISNNDNDSTLHTTTLPKIAPFFSSKKVSENNYNSNNNNSYLDQTTLSSIPLAKNLKKEGKILDFEGIFAPKTLTVPNSTRSNGNGMSSLGITLNTTYRSQLNDSMNHNNSRDQSKSISPVKQSLSQKGNIFLSIKQKSNNSSRTHLDQVA